MSSAIVVTQGRHDALAALISQYSGNFLVGLRTDTNPVTAGMTMSQITEPTWSGYTRLAPTPWGAITTAANGDAQALGQSVTFTNSGTTTATITGYFLYNAATGLLYAAFTLTTALALAAGASYQLTPTLSMGYCQ